jgi:FtsP/CotA-like multicopper oxidase with cupredoxin domain
MSIEDHGMSRAVNCESSRHGGGAGPRLAILASTLALAACGDNLPPEPAFEPATFVDTNPDPDVVEVELVAEPGTHEYLAGKPASVWAFRDGAAPGAAATIPGPLLAAKLGDRVIVHFRNDLPDVTTVHWHGLRVPNEHDGTHASQVLVEPGATHDYEFVLQDAGLYWYHPHIDGDVQVERGLYGPIVVASPRDVDIDVAADRVLVLDDVKVESTGLLSGTTDNLDLMLGRQGNVVLANGARDAVVDAAAGSRERWRIVNTANGRYFHLELPGRTFQVIGWDGGLVDEPYATERLLVAPGERYDVLVELGGAPGDRLALRTVHYDRGHDIPDPGPIDILALQLGAAAEPPAPLPSSWGEVAAIAVDDTTAVRRFVLREDDTDPTDPVFTINDEAFPAITPVEVGNDDVEIWEVENATEMDHPFHLHGMSFHVIGAEPLAWKDTVNVPREQTVRLAVRFGATGRWMYHCHILEYAERGMMGELVVRP